MIAFHQIADEADFPLESCIAIQLFLYVFEFIKYLILRYYE